MRRALLNSSFSRAHPTSLLPSDPATRTLFLLGTLPSATAGAPAETAIVKLEKAAFDTHAEDGVQQLMNGLGRLDSLGGNDIVRLVSKLSSVMLHSFLSL